MIDQELKIETGTKTKSTWVKMGDRRYDGATAKKNSRI